MAHAVGGGRTGRNRWLRTGTPCGIMLCGISLSWIMGGPVAHAQVVPTEKPVPTAALSTQMTNQIHAASIPYRIEWNGVSGTLERQAFAHEPAQKMPLVYLHADPGPTGYARHLAWFLARDANGFALLWCYLNESGRDFWCWLYRFPTNQLTTLRFAGDYQFTPPAEPVPPVPAEAFRLPVVPRYLGPDFAFRDWTRQAGQLDHLDLLPAKAETFLPGNDGLQPRPGSTGTSAASQTLVNLRILPLHELNIPPANGWRQEGWRELHALAYDKNFEPYYIILYSNATHGYVVDIKRAQTYIADFGERVIFSSNAPEANKNLFAGAPEAVVPRNQRHEITLISKQTHANPYAEVLLSAELRDPDGKRLTVSGYWDGEQTWRIRVAPAIVGTWTWRTRCNDPDLDGQQGTFECVAEHAGKPFLRVQHASQRRHHFGAAEETSFLPAFLHEPVHCFSGPNTQGVQQGSKTVIASDGAKPDDTKPDKETLPASFVAFQKRVEACAALGFNRFVGGYLLAGPTDGMNSQANEGGTLFLDNDPDRPNPAYFQWMDRRIAACNAKGIVPDIGLAVLDRTLLADITDNQLRQLWRYVLARYAAYDICWNLFGASANAPIDAADQIAALAELTRRYDPYQHPLTTVMAGVASMPPALSKTNAPDLSASLQAGGTVPTAPVSTAETIPLLGFAGATWLDVLTLQITNLDVVNHSQRIDKPIVVMEEPSQAGSESPIDTARLRLWETRMRGGYYAGAVTAAEAAGHDPAGVAQAQQAAACAHFFQATRFWRLQPRPEYVGGPEETTAERRRRLRAEEEDSHLPPPSSAVRTKPPNPKPDPTSVFLLADPGWEYILYFPHGGTTRLDLLEATGTLRMTWFNPRTGQFDTEDSVHSVKGGASRSFTAPDTNDWVLYLSRR